MSEKRRFKMKAKNGRVVEYELFDSDDSVGCLFYHSASQKKKGECSSIDFSTFTRCVESGDIELIVTL